MAKPVAPRGSARERVLQAALTLFMDNSVGGTSMQMIADQLGVSKPAVYYQFRSRDDIVIALVEPMFDDIVRIIKIAQAMPTGQGKRDVTVSGVVELAVRYRRLTFLFYDRAVEHAVRSREDFMAVRDDVAAILHGPEPDATTRVITTALLSGTFTAAADPQLEDIDDEELHEILLATAQRMVSPLA
ncbi:TetR/AcrR family transcriptional regulator [Mycolicibacter sp. MYC123]|uniref:TetR/AcrR family transcriptional regulator n=1 Tax=[Mycobacterium] zoologicum TaxID=2872311 RepID=A0ABU5YHN5_9MYCO|nr:MULTISPECIES: TetR/AcrR family transcriptional regulator [unclassified Mycolicibacter]MEB3049537.1 TetR/AcrR family transcriptional regulator [Mycolicibacter sp. MYC123]MEB3064644.1 TetR/AcrR family transcriptional regulator [Mycolicibacter sp. MYC101]